MSEHPTTADDVSDSKSAASIVEDSDFLQLLGDNSKPRVLLAMVASQGIPMNKSEIARRAGIDRSVLERGLWDDLEDLGVIEAAGKDRNATEWRLDTDHPAVQALYQVDIGIFEQEALEKEGPRPDDLDNGATTE